MEVHCATPGDSHAFSSTAPAPGLRGLKKFAGEAAEEAATLGKERSHVASTFFFRRCLQVQGKRDKGWSPPSTSSEPHWAFTSQLGSFSTCISHWGCPQCDLRASNSPTPQSSPALRGDNRKALLGGKCPPRREERAESSPTSSTFPWGGGGLCAVENL